MKKVYVYEKGKTEETILKEYHDKVKIGIIGSRSLTQPVVVDVIKAYIKDALYIILTERNLTIEDIVIVSGGAKGVDTIAEQIADELGIDMIVIRPNYKYVYPKRAPIERNTGIAKVSDIMLAYITQNSKGSLDAIRKFKKFHPNNLLVIETF